MLFCCAKNRRCYAVIWSKATCKNALFKKFCDCFLIIACKDLHFTAGAVEASHNSKRWESVLSPPTNRPVFHISGGTVRKISIGRNIYLDVSIFWLLIRIPGHAPRLCSDSEMTNQSHNFIPCYVFKMII